MATKISTAKLKVSAEGTKGVAQQLDQVGKATERVGRAQTRLGQASASAGRQFSAQASGLGGLVAAYAGAAATVFALQAAFDALNRAARAETIIQGTKALAVEIGQSGPRILKEIKSITQGQIELSEAAQNINIALSAGFNTEQISRLTKVSLGASRALGRNLTDALQRVVRGAAKLEPELLDELGIFTRIDPAVNKYAQRLGVAASQLTDFERRQAFVNAVITEGERKFSSIDVSSKSTQKSLEQLQTQIQELGLEFGQLIANFLLPLVDFFKNNAGNTLLLFGGILGLVFGKALEIIGNFSKVSINNVSDFANNLASSAAKSKGATDIIIKGQKDLAAVVAKNKRGLGGDAAFTKGLTRDLSSAAAEARRRFLSGEDVDSRQRAKDVETLTKAQKGLTAAGRQQSAAFSDARKIIDTYGDAQKKAGLRATALTKLSVGLQTAIRGVAAAAAFAGTALNVLFLGFGAAQLIGSLFDVDLISKIKEIFIDTSQAAKDLNTGLVGLTTAAVGGGAALTNIIREIKDDPKVIENLDEDITDLFRTIEKNRTRRPGKGQGKRFRDDVGFEQSALESIKKLEKEINKLKDKGELKNAKAIEDKRVELEITQALLAAERQFGLENRRLVGQLARATGLNLDKVPQTFQEAALGVSKTNDELRIAGILIPKIAGEFSLSNLTEDQREAVEANTLFNAVLAETNKAFEAGALNSDKLSAKISGLGAQFITAKEKGKLTADEIARFNEELTRLRNNQVELKALETITTGIAKAFGSAFTALDTAPFKGLVDLSGNLADNSLRAKENQALLLKSIVETNKEAAELVKNAAEGQEIDPLTQERAQNFNLAIKAAAGSIVEYYQTALKVIEAEKIKSAQLDKQTKALEDQLKIQKLQRDNALAIETEKQNRDVVKNIFDVKEKTLELDRLRFDLSQKEIAAEQKIAAQLAKNAATRLRVDSINRQTGVNADEAARTLNQGILENQLAILEERSFKNETAINDKKREIIELERQYANERFAEQKTIIDEELRANLEQLRIQKDLETSRLAQLNTQKTALEGFNAEQLRLFDRQTNLEVQKLRDQKAQLERERIIAQERASAQITAIDADEKIFEQQSQQTIAQLEGFKNFADTVNTFVSATGPDSPFVKAIAEILNVAQKDAGTELTDNLKKIPQVTTKALTDAIALTQGNIDKQGGIFGLRRDSVNQQASGNAVLNILKQVGIDKQIDGLKEVRALERDILATTLAGKVSELDAEIRLQQAKLDGIPLQELELRAQATQKIEQLEQQRTQTLEELNRRVDTLARSEDRLAIALDQSQVIIESQLTGAFMKLNDALIDGSITMDMVGQTFKDMVGNMLREIQAAVFRQTIVEPIAGAISGSVGTLFTGAQGGRVHMAGGGLKRDRVPALLEPGEFVMRKEAVKEAGLGTMMRMNAAPQQLSSGSSVRRTTTISGRPSELSVEDLNTMANSISPLARKKANEELARRGLAPTTPLTASGRSFAISTSPFSDPISTGPKMNIDPGLASAAASAVQLNLAGQRASNMFKNTPTSSAGTPKISPSTQALAASLVGVEGMSPGEALTVALGAQSSKAGFNARGPLDDVLGAKGVQLDLGALPLIGAGVNLARMITGNQDLGRIQAVPKVRPTASQGRARLEVFNRTGQMATGNKLGFQAGDVTPSGNFMRAGPEGVVSNIDPFALDKLGFTGGVAATMGGSKGFRRSGTGVEFGSVGDFVSAITTPGRQSALTVEEYNAASPSFRQEYAPGLGGARALSFSQSAQLSAFGGYSNTVGGGYTIPTIGGVTRFSGTIKSPSRVGGDFVSGLAAGFSRDSDGGGGGFVAGGSMGGVSAAGAGAFSAMERDDFQGFMEEASGGLVRRMAAGGAVRTRDRVPALLEPGEFVIRRPMAKAIGGPALNQMNATGNTLTPPNIQVNLNNQGVPKNAQSKPARIEGDKIIIDMITRDLRNNGPIKKSLRK